MVYCWNGANDGEQFSAIGSWTSFHKSVTKEETEKCVQEYLPVIPEPPEYPVCKEYLDFLLEVIEYLEIPHIFVHSDEMIYAKLCHILWKNKDLYRSVILLMGGFHQLRVCQRLLFKRFHCKGYKEWCIDAGVIAAGSADQALNGKHYFRCMRLHKEMFDALIQTRIEDLTKNFTEVNAKLLSNLQSLRWLPNFETLNAVLKMPEFNNLVSEILQYNENSERHLTVTYLKDVSSMLAMVSAVRGSDIERHLQAEREMISKTFAFNHQNYARYLSYQHVFLRDMEEKGHPAFHNLRTKVFEGSISGDRFSTIHGDLITELFNKETKGTAGPFRSEFSSNIEAVNTWVHTIHVHSKLRVIFREHLRTKTSAKHKELTPGSKKKHMEHVKNLRAKLKSYGLNQFAESAPKCITTGEEIDLAVVYDMLHADAKGNEKHLQFSSEHLVNGTKGFFDPIKKLKLQTGVEKGKKTPRAMSLLKEDRQAFGLIIAKATSLEEAFEYQITSVPLSLATPDATLRQSEKASLQNFLINDSGSFTDQLPKNAHVLLMVWQQ